MTYEDCAMYRSDYKKIDKLNQLTNLETFNEDCRKLTRNTCTDFHMHRWECLADIRQMELEYPGYSCRELMDARNEAIHRVFDSGNTKSLRELMIEELKKNGGEN